VTKIKISYTDEAELTTIMTLLDPILEGFRTQKSNRKDPYKCVYMTPKKKRKPVKQGV
jgi:hypothetical protein